MVVIRFIFTASRWLPSGRPTFSSRIVCDSSSLCVWEPLDLPREAMEGVRDYFSGVFMVVGTLKAAFLGPVRVAEEVDCCEPDKEGAFEAVFDFTVFLEVSTEALLPWPCLAGFSGEFLGLLLTASALPRLTGLFTCTLAASLVKSSFSLIRPSSTISFVQSGSGCICCWPRVLGVTGTMSACYALESSKLNLEVSSSVVSIL